MGYYENMLEMARLELKRFFCSLDALSKRRDEFNFIILV